MMIKRSVWIWLFTVAVIFLIVLYQFFKLDNAKKLLGEFDRVAYVRNENNQGGIYQYYAYTVSDTSIADYPSLVQMIPLHGKVGETTVFFFYKEDAYPTVLSLEEPHFDTSIYTPVKTLVRNKAGIHELK